MTGLVKDADVQTRDNVLKRPYVPQMTEMQYPIHDFYTRRQTFDSKVRLVQIKETKKSKSEVSQTEEIALKVDSEQEQFEFLAKQYMMELYENETVLPSFMFTEDMPAYVGPKEV